MAWRSERFPAPGETRLGRFQAGPGGKGFNQAVAAARQGATVCFVGALGADDLADTARAVVQHERIDARWQSVGAEATGTAAIWLDHSGQNEIIVAPGANLALSPEHIDAHADAFADASVLVTQHEVAPEATLRAMQRAARHGLLRIHNPAPAQRPPQFDAMLALTDVLTPNESEFAALFERAATPIRADAVATLADADLHALCRRLPVATVVITLGASGIFVSHADAASRGDASACYRIAAEAVEVVDTTGAGDAFNGGLAASRALGADRPFAEHVRHGNRVAACAVACQGAALAMPYRDDVLRRFPG
ncbi:MAG: ribokinase [Xanthomonadales bacterium]|nr:ribokinase [Xanthomonadales bacterium]